MGEKQSVNEVGKDSGIKRFRWPLRIVLVLIVLAVLVLLGVDHLAAPCDRTDATYSDFVVAEDDGLSDVADKLDDAGIINDASDFELLAKITFAGSFRPGLYYLSPSMSSFRIMHTLQNGLTTSKGFTIPAGYTIEQIANALDRDGIADKEKFLAAASSDMLSEFDILDGNKDLKGIDRVEGFLIPDEYSLSSDADESMLVIMMLDSFSNYFNEDYRARADELGMSIREVVIVASIIEKETSVDKERAAISSVIHNRFNLGLASEEETPKKPLCNPSKASIEAALYPEENEYTHYVLSSSLDGTHVFTDNDEEYKTLKEEYKAALKEKEAQEAEKDPAEEAEGADEDPQASGGEAQ